MKFIVKNCLDLYKVITDQGYDEDDRIEFIIQDSTEFHAIALRFGANKITIHEIKK